MDPLSSGPRKLILGLVIAATLNYCLNNLMEESGLDAVLVSGSLVHAESGPDSPARHVARVRSVTEDLFEARKLVRVDSLQAKPPRGLATVLIVAGRGNELSAPPRELDVLLS